MFVALDKNNNLIDADEAIVGEKYYCPQCKNELILKNGLIKVPHFAHSSISDCDDFTHDMSEWHRLWQKKFPKENREVVITLEVDELTYEAASGHFNFYHGDWYAHHNRWENLILTDPKMLKTITISHRADVCIGEYVIEFQNSKISTREFNERNWFYNEAGYTVIWIFNVEDLYNEERLELYDETDSKYGGGKWKWKNPWKVWQNWNPKDKDILVFINLDDEHLYSDDPEICGYIERITWAPIKIDENEEDITVFNRFITEYYPGDFSELMELINKKPIQKTYKKPETNKETNSTKIDLGYGFYKGDNEITKKKILYWLHNADIEWNAFLWYIAQYAKIKSYNENSFIVQINSEKHRQFFYDKVRDYDSDCWENNYEYDTNGDLWKSHHRGYKENANILSQLAIGKKKSE